MAELKRLNLSPGALRVEVDDPADRRLIEPTGYIRGWFATVDTEIPEDFHLTIAGSALPYDIVKREDVQAALPGHSVVGFRIPYDLSVCLPHIQDEQLIIDLALPGYDPYRLRFKIENSALAACLESAGEV